MLSDDDFCNWRAEARQELEGYGEPSYVLRPFWRTFVAREMKGWVQARRRETKQQWHDIVDLAVNRPKHIDLGFIAINDGGLRSLAVELGKQPGWSGHLAEKLRGWEEQGLLHQFYGPKIKNYPAVVGLQLPWATEAQLAIADISTALGPPGYSWWQEKVEQLVRECAKEKREVPVVHSAEDCRRELRRLRATGT